MTEPEEGTKRVTVRMDESTVNRLDDLIWENKIEGTLDREVSRSDLLREKVDELIDELEGNSSTMMATAD
ncbi:hypothetical protein [Halobaculum sp. EA56]|uniref:hypothetical protein n=1 Tax=Halobaculum sp. EA56 TaxID=3421648 RepID=UPI003EBB477E